MLDSRTNKITVKQWIADQKIEEAHKYHLNLNRKHNDDGTVTFDLDEPILKETEKAIQVAIKTETFGDRYHKAMTFWIPKSQIVM